MRKKTRWTHFGKETAAPETPELKPIPEQNPLETGLAFCARIASGS